MSIKARATTIAMAATAVLWAAGSAAVAAPNLNSNCTDQWVATKTFGNVGADSRQYAPSGQIAAFYGGFAQVHELNAADCLGLLG